MSSEILSGSGPKIGLRLRLTLLFLALFGATLIAFSLILYRHVIQMHEQDLDTALYNYAVDISQEIELDPFGAVYSAPELMVQPTKIFPFAANNVYITIRNIRGEELAKSRNLGRYSLPFGQEDATSVNYMRGFFKTIRAKDLTLPVRRQDIDSYRILSALSPGRLSRDFILQVAVPRTSITQSTQTVRGFLLFGIPLTLLIASFMALILSRRALLPLRKIIDSARKLDPMSLKQRVPVPDAKDELRELALTLNELLNRLQKTFESQERFIADASHELKTPLAILKGELELMLSRTRSAEETSAFCESASQELDHLSRTVEDLLILARVDAGVASLDTKPTRMDEVLIEVSSRLERLARSKGIRIKVDLNESGAVMDSFFSLVDPDLISVSIKNLIENAIKYSPESSLVKATLISEPDQIKICVSDQGPGIPEEARKKIFDRFVRLETRAKGAGLGLAIAHKIADLHGGSLTAENLPQGGAIFTLSLPHLKPQSPALRH